MGVESWPVDPHAVREIVGRALDEDIGPGDITARALIPADLAATGEFIAKQAGVAAGLYVARTAFELLDPGAQWEQFVGEGQEFQPGDVLARVSGLARALLSAERTALNFLQRLCGVATLTREYVRAIEGTKCRLLDTRKTTPGLRLLEKAAVRAGGGSNHRFALYDGTLIKDNHIRAVGSVAEAIRRARQFCPPTAAIEVEVQSFEQLEEALEAGADVIMLDNFTPEKVAEAVRIINGRALVEASGGITPENARAYAEAGVDFISAGRITHSAPAIDISLEFTVVQGP